MKIGIVGCGVIAATYIQALNRLDGLFRITALYDVNPDKAKALCFPEAKRCDSLAELIDTDVDCVVVSTPLHTHTRIAEACLRGGKHVLMEKPAALSVAEISRLFALAEEMGVIFHVAFHSSFALDINWYLEHFGAADCVYGAENIRHIQCGFYDPYMTKGVVAEDRKSLGGSYIDSGVNILSVCSRLVPMDAMQLQSHTICRTADGVVYASETVFSDARVQLLMCTGWDKGLNQKRTCLRFAGTDTALLLDHSGQAVWSITPDGQRQLLYKEDDTERLVNHYTQVFKVFDKALKTRYGQTHRNQVMNVHRLLFSAEGRECV